ncbi:hypothetical protein PsorP6_012213 [Peronosclerospora sorghi]|uniref:Uncharacterized protein n=1 Tax=Peronosclerospora sorghi TaxID=230839 RepID=A0ACC0WJQ6_9STRA|nr:hypothetical protein PsorP6_012213 [Peronosclerospora sorghi]
MHVLSDNCVASSVENAKVRRHQTHLSVNQMLAATSCMNQENRRGGPEALEELQLRILARNQHFVVLNKGSDERMDGEFKVTIEKALTRDFPEINKFRWIHQLDFAESWVKPYDVVVSIVVFRSSNVGCPSYRSDERILCEPKAGLIPWRRLCRAAATGCRLFREKQVQKEYLAIVRGHLPSNPADSVDRFGVAAKACTFSKLDFLIQDMEEIEKLRNQQRGSRAHEKASGYPRGVRHGPNILAMEQAQLLRESQTKGNAPVAVRRLTPTELAFTRKTWQDLMPVEKEAYKAKAEDDKQRFLREFTEFLRMEKVRLAYKRQYACLDREKSNRNATEPAAYIFDAPIVEPHRRTGAFRMHVGTEADTEAKQSTTIAFVLGHAQYNGQPVTKVLLRPLNGRRHQLRLHLAHHGFPILGDVTYGSQEDEAPRMMLHAWKIWLHGSPADEEKYGAMYFESPDPFESIVPNVRNVCTISYNQKRTCTIETGMTTISSH